MTKHLLQRLAFGLLLAATLVIQLQAASPVLVWSDEFDQPIGSGPDMSRWSYDLGDGGWGNQELQTYTDLVDNASVAADPQASATYLNWLVMGEPVNRAMLLGDESVPDHAAIEAHCAEAVRIFLAAFGAVERSGKRIAPPAGEARGAIEGWASAGRDQ